MIEYNGISNSDSDNNTEFIYDNLPCNKLSIWLLANNFIACTKKKRVLETEDKANELPTVKATWEKKIPIKQIGKKV